MFFSFCVFCAIFDKFSKRKEIEMEKNEFTKKVINDPIIVKPEEDIKRYADIASYYNKIFT